MTYEERRVIKAAISERARQREGVVACPMNYGTERGYSAGCRCVMCRQAAVDNRRERLRRQVEREKIAA